MKKDKGRGSSTTLVSIAAEDDAARLREAVDAQHRAGTLDACARDHALEQVDAQTRSVITIGELEDDLAEVVLSRLHCSQAVE